MLDHACSKFTTFLAFFRRGWFDPSDDPLHQAAKSFLLGSLLESNKGAFGRSLASCAPAVQAMSLYLQHKTPRSMTTLSTDLSSLYHELLKLHCALALLVQFWIYGWDSPISKHSPSCPFRLFSLQSHTGHAVCNGMPCISSWAWGGWLDDASSHQQQYRQTNKQTNKTEGIEASTAMLA